MKKLEPALALAFAACFAQSGVRSQQPMFGLNADVVNFATRGSLGTSGGEICTGFGPSVVRGLGESLGGTTVTGMRTVVQDPYSGTPELYQLVLRTGSEATGPGNTPASILMTTGQLSTPGTGTGAAAWLITLTFATPVAIPTDGYFTAGIVVTAPGGGFDSLYLHSAMSSSTGAHRLAPDVTWQINGTTNVVSHPPNKLLPRINLLMPSGVFQVGNIAYVNTAPLFGLGGSYPDTTAAGPATQGIAFAVTHPLGGRGNALVFASIALNPSPFVIPGFLNRLQLDGATLIPAALASGPAYGAPMPFLPAGIGALPVGLNAALVFQALVVSQVQPIFEFTNAEIVHLL